jgi:site-specific DNA recombinase
MTDQTITSPEQTRLTKRAFVYLRVSTDDQANTGYSRDGLSITAQREAAKDKAARHGAEVVHNWGDPGKSAFTDLHRRTDFLEMLDELKRCNQQGETIDFVIVYALDRWARNVQDYYRTRELVSDAGSQLLSVTEPMVGEDSPESFYFEGMQAVHAEYESRRTARRVSGGLLQKAKEGGTYGPAKLGYVNDLSRLPDGRQVPGVSFDPARHHYITAGFKFFATGDYSLTRLADEMYEIGLRSRPTRRHPASTRKVKSSTWQRLLRDPYYAGWIVYKAGTPAEQTFPARHDALIDQDTFDRVQMVLDERRVSGERTQKHNHYLKGTVFCGESGHRLIYGPSRGKNGQVYDYFFCASRIREKECSMRRNIRPELIEEAIRRYYVEHSVQLSLKEVARRTEAIEALVAVSQEAVAQVKEVKSELVAKLEAEQVRLLRLHVEEGDDISPNAFRAERKRISKEIEAAKKSLAATEQRMTFDATMLRMALELAGDVAEVYEQATPAVQRAYNQAFFKRINVMPDWDDSGEMTVRVISAELTEPFKVVLAESFATKIQAAAKRLKSAGKAKAAPLGAAFWSVFDLEAIGGEGGIRTLERACAPYSLSRRVPSATRPPLRALRLRL